MYRVQYKSPKEWVFLCKEYLVKVKIDNLFYTYGDIGSIKYKKTVLSIFFDQDVYFYKINYCIVILVLRK